MGTKTFEDYLEEVFMEGGNYYTDDTLTDDFDEWLQTLSVEEWLRYGQRFAELKYGQGKVDGLDSAINTIKAHNEQKTT